MHGESCNDQERQEDIKREGDRKVWKAEVDGYGVPDATVRLGGLVDEHDTHRCISNVSRRCCYQIAMNTPKEVRYTRHGKAMIQDLLSKIT